MGVTACWSPAQEVGKTARMKAITQMYLCFINQARQGKSKINKIFTLLMDFLQGQLLLTGDYAHNAVSERSRQ